MTQGTIKTVGLVVTLGTAGFLVAGPLNPPAGPVAPTHKTLSEVQPRVAVQMLPGNGQALYVISQPGSYYLTGKITGQAGKNGILVTASDVSIDLCGFVMDGAGVGTGAITAGSVSGLSVRNGAISNWVSAGVFATGSTGCVVEALRCRGNGDAGVRTGAGSVVRGCAFSGGQKGVVAESGTRVVDCSSTGATQYAFWLGDGSSATQCAAYNPGAVGFYAPGTNASVIDCVVRGGTIGVQLNSGNNRVQGCKIGQATTGIWGSYANTIVGNTINASATGVGVGINLTLGANRIDGNHVYAFDQGISVAAGSTDVVVRNAMSACAHPINGTGPMVAAVVTTAAGLTGNPMANMAQ